MLHPVGSQPPTIYWRRRLLVLASIALLIVLIALTARTILGGGSGEQASAGTGTSGQPAAPHQTGGAATTPATGKHAGTSAGRQQSASGSSTRAAVGGSTGGSAGAPTGAAPAKCTPGQLAVSAVVGKRRYVVGDQPVLTLRVTNTGPRPCVQDVADSQILLRVYNGASRVWGSHDCQIEPGVDDRTLVVGAPASFSIVWSGLTSERKCAGTRQRVGAGTYTLYASLSGHEGKAAQFVIS